jgi:hypothetical protein
MSKKTNTLLFILGATVFNILVTIISFFALFFLYSRVLASRLSDSAFIMGIVFVFIGAIAASFLVYQALLKLLIKKVKVDQYFEAIFTRRKK